MAFLEKWVSFVKNAYETLIAIPLMLYLLLSNEARNCVRVREGLNQTAKGLHDVVRQGIETMHLNIKAKIGALPPCSGCFIPCRTCSAWKREIALEFEGNFKLKPKDWKMADSQHWSTNMWEMAKVFSPTMMYSNQVITSEKDLDLISLCNMLLNCKQFTGMNTNLFRDLKTKRNFLDAHNPTQKVSNSDTQLAFKSMKDVLKIPKVRATGSGKKALEEIKKLENPNKFIAYCFRFVLLIIISGIFLYSVPTWVWVLVKVYFYAYCVPVYDISRYGCPLENKWIPYSPLELKFHHEMERSRDFVGREWFFNDIKRLLSDTKAVLIEGPMGIGKSAFVAAAVCHFSDSARETFPNVLAYHKCQFDDIKTQDPVRFIRNMADMIAKRWPQYAFYIYSNDFIRKQLTYEECLQDVSNCFEQVILNSFSHLGPLSSSQAIIIDALDECKTDRFEGESIARLLEKKLVVFPDWIKVVATTRNSDCHEAGFYQWTKVQLNAEDKRNVQDLQHFVQNMQIKSLNLKLGNSSSLLRLSKGHFLHLKEILKKVDTLGYKADSTIEGVYLANFERLWGKKGEYFTTTKYCLELMLASNIPLNDHTLFEYLHGSRKIDLRFEDFKKDTQNIALIMSRDNELNWRFNHQHITYWLTAPHRVGHAFYVNAQNGHQVIADYYVKQAEYQTSAVDIVEMAYHILKANNKTLERRFKELPSNFIRLTGGLFENGWSVKSPKVVELALFHLQNRTGIETALYWSAIYGHDNTISSLLEHGGDEALHSLFKNDYIIPFFKSGTLIELAYIFSPKTAETIELLQNAVQFWQKQHSRNSSIMLYPFIKTYLLSSPMARCFEKSVSTNVYQDLESQLKDVLQVKFNSIKESFIDKQHDHLKLHIDENIVLCLAITTNNIDLARIVLEKWKDESKKYFYIWIMDKESYNIPKKDVIEFTLQNNLMLHLAILFGNTKMISTLLESEKLDPYLYCGSNGHAFNTALHLAVLGGHNRIIKILLDKYPDLLEIKEGNYNMTALQLAIVKNKTESLKILLRQGAELTVLPQTSDNPLHLAYQVGNLEMVKLIMKKAPNLVKGANSFSLKPAELAIANGHVHILQEPALYSDFTEKNALVLAVATGCEHVVNVVTQENGSNPWWSGKEKEDFKLSALHVAAISGTETIIYKLLKLFPEIMNIALTTNMNVTHKGNYYTSLYTRDILNQTLQFFEAIPFKKANVIQILQQWNANPKDTDMFEDDCDISSSISRIVGKFSGTIELEFILPTGELFKKIQSRLNETWESLTVDIFEANKLEDRPWETKSLLHTIWTKLVIHIHNFCTDYTLVCLKSTFTKSEKYVFFSELYQNACEYVVGELSSPMAVSSLDFALALNHTNASLALIQAGAAMNLSDEKAHRSYRIAMEQGNLKIMKALNKAIVHSNTTMESFMWDLKSHLYAAAYRGKLEIVRHFMSSLSGQIDAEVLLVATFGGDIDTISYLLDSGIKVGTVCKDLGSERFCLNAIHVAAMRNFVEILEMLLVRFPTALNAPSEPFKMSALDFALAYDQTEASIHLLKCETRLGKMSDELLVAIRSGNLAVIRNIMTKVFVTKWNLYVAIFYGNLEIIKEIDSRTNITDDKEKIQLLYMAILSGRVQTVRYVLQNLPRYDITEDVRVALWKLSNNKNVPSEVILLKELYMYYSSDDKVNPARVGAYYGCIDIMNLLLEYFPLDVKDFCYRDHIPLEVAIERNHTITALLLIKQCSKDKINPNDIMWETLELDITDATRNSNFEIVKYFLKLYPKIASLDGIRFIAAEKGNLKILHELSKYTSLDDGHTLCLAVTFNHMHIFEFLLSLNISNTTCILELERCDPTDSVKALATHPNLLNEYQAFYGRGELKPLQIGLAERQRLNNVYYLALTLNRTEMFFKLIKQGNFPEGIDKAITKNNSHLYLKRGMETGNVEFVSNMLSNRPELLNFVDSCGNTLGESAAVSSTEMLKMVSRIKDLDDGKTLCAAVSNNKTENVKYLIEYGVTNTSWDSIESSSSSVLDLALSKQHNEIAMILIKHFPSLICTHEQEDSIFHAGLYVQAMNNKDRNSLTALIEAKVLNCISKKHTFDILAAATSYEDTITMEYILSETPDIVSYATKDKKFTPIFTAAISGSSKTLKVFSKYFSLDDGVTLCYAVANNSVENVFFLLQLGVKNTSCVAMLGKNSAHDSVLHVALQNQDPKIIMMLLEHFPNLLIDGKTVAITHTHILLSLRSSALSNNPDLMELLIKLGLFKDISVENVLGVLLMVMNQIELPKEYAFKNDSEAVTYVAMLLRNKPEVVTTMKSRGMNLCNWAAVNGSSEMLKIVARHFDIDDGSTLGLAVSNNRVEKVSYLLTSGVKNVWYCIDGFPCTTVLLLAVGAQNVKMTKILVEHFASYVDAVQNGRENNPIEGSPTPLSLAVQLNHTEIAHVLIQAGANAVVPTKHGINPLSVAIVHRNYYIAAMLLSKFSELKAFRSIFRVLPRHFAQASDSSLYSSMESEQRKNHKSFQRHTLAPNILHQEFQYYVHSSRRNEFNELLKKYVFASLIL